MPNKKNNYHFNELSKPPLARFLVADTSNVDEAWEAASRTYCDHQQKLIGKADSFRFRLHRAPLSKSQITHVSYGADTYIDAGQTETFYLMLFPQAGTTKCWVGGQICEATPSMGMVGSATLPLHFNFGATCEQIALTVDRKALEDQLCALTGVLVREPIIFQPHLKTTSGFGAQFQRVLDFLVVELDAVDSLQGNPLLVNNFEQMLMISLFTSQGHNYSAFFEKLALLAANWQVKRVEEYIRAHAADPITAEELSMLTGQSERSLYRAFRKYRGYTPMAFLRETRLMRVRETLLKAEPGMTVTKAAMKWAFNNLGRLSAEYVKKFGESPSDTLRKGKIFK